MQGNTILSILAACIMISSTQASAQSAAGADTEALVEQAIARYAEQLPPRAALPGSALPPLAAAKESGHHEPLRGPVPPTGVFIGVDDAATPAHFIDPETGIATEAFPAEVWSAAHVPVDAANYLIFLTEGAELLVSSNGQAPTPCCSLTMDGASRSPTGMAFDPTGQRLIFSRNISPESLLSLPYSATMCTAGPTCNLTEAVTIDEDVVDLGGLAWDSDNSVLYATNDDSDLRGLVSVDFSGSITSIAPYPDGQTDIDGLAYHDGKLYLVTDQPGSIYVYNLATSTYEAPLPNPWTTSEIFSGAAFVTAGPSDVIFRDGFDPGEL